MKIVIKLLFNVMFLSNLYLHAISYSLKGEPIDVVIPAHPKDLMKLEFAIKGIKKYGKNVRRVIVVSAEKYTDEAEWICEGIYPFNKDSISKYLSNEVLHEQRSFRRVGWMYQQLLKLYSPFVIPDISSNVLVLDADTIFLNPVEFIDSEGRALYNVGTEHHKPYFRHAKQLIKDPIIKRLFPKFSGICHHMLFQRAVLEDLFSRITEKHNVEPWKAFLKCVDSKELDGSCFSEYEIYFNFVFSQTDQVRIRHLRWANSRFSESRIRDLQKNGFHYVSCHSYMR